MDEQEPALLAERDQLAARVTELAALAEDYAGRWRESRVTGALTLALQEAGCRDIEAALVLADRAGLAMDEAGAVTGVTEAVSALQAARRYLFTPRAAGGAANPGSAPLPGDPAAAFAQWLRGEG